MRVDLKEMNACVDITVCMNTPKSRHKLIRALVHYINTKDNLKNASRFFLLIYSFWYFYILFYLSLFACLLYALSP